MWHGHGLAVREAGAALGDDGRVLVRYSGTENLFRVMDEAPTEERTNLHCARTASVIEKILARP
jgi:phosphoglucosamine mutase